MSKLYKIAFYEDKFTNGETRLRFKQIEQFVPTPGISVDEIAARGVPVSTVSLSDGTPVAVANSIFRMWHVDADMQGVHRGEIFQITT